MLYSNYSGPLFCIQSEQSAAYFFWKMFFFFNFTLLVFYATRHIMLSRSARGQRDRARPAKSDIMVNVFFVFLFFSVGHNLIRWAKPKLTDSAHHWMNLACGLIYFFFFFTGAISAAALTATRRKCLPFASPPYFPTSLFALGPLGWFDQGD